MPGAGLLMLRMFLGGSVIIHSGFYLANQENASPWIALVCLIGVVCGVFLLVGFLTPIVSMLIGLAATIIFVSSLGSFPTILPQLNFSSVCSILLASALVFLGPGAFSIDARLFGRREIIIPPSRPR